MGSLATSSRTAHRGAVSTDPLQEALELLESAPSAMTTRRFRWQPEVTLAEDDHRLEIRVELPRTRADQVRVRLADDLLTIEADRRLDPARSGGSGFVRSFLLPVPVRAEAVDAVMVHGVLSVTVDKRRQPLKRRVPLA